MKEVSCRGETLSPILFTIYMDDLVTEIHDANITPVHIGNSSVHCVLYADDIVLVAHNIFDMQEKVNVLKRYLTQNGLVVNLTKTNVIRFRNSRKPNPKPHLFWDDNVIEYCNQYKYLGVEFRERYNNSKTCKDFINKAEIAKSQLMELFYKAN